MTELEVLSQFYKIDVIAVTEVQAQNPDLLKINNCSQFTKSRPHDHPLGKKGGGILLIVGDYLVPKGIHSPKLSDYDEIILVSVKPKIVPCHFNLIVFCCFYYSQIKKLHKDSNFYSNYIVVADFVFCKFNDAGIFQVGDANDLKLNSLCSSLN